MIKRLGKYEILSELGRGGFGRVYRALDPVLGMVAIKTLTIENDPAILTRFRNEAAAARRLSHPNIVTIYDFGEQDGVPFIVMQLLEGQDLDKVIQNRTPLPLWQKIRIMTQTAAGLFHAHSNGVIHRDVKPGNIMLLPEGDVKIMDFGIALASRDTFNRVTPRGTVIGTLRYMAPEQFHGTGQDARSDIFSFGLVFYELLSGIHPFYANDPASLMNNVLNRDPAPIKDVCPECPDALQPVIARLLLKDPDYRYQSLEDVIFDCEPVLEQLQRASAGDLFEQAKRARGDGQMEAAQGFLRQAMDLDAAYPGLREFREELQTELRRLAVRPRLEALAQEAQKQLAAGNSTDAVQKLEAAARLDPADSGLQTLLEQTKAAAERARRVVRLLAEAERALNEGNPSVAQHNAQQAVDASPSASPTSDRAHELLQRARQVQAEQQQQMRLADGLGRARRLLSLRSWDEAAEVLETLRREFPNHDEVRTLGERLAASRQEEQRQQRLSAEQGAARSEIKAGNLEGAQTRLTALRREFPENSGVEQMLQAVDSEIEARKHQEQVETALREARAFAQQNAFEEAMAVLRKVLDRYPSDLLLRSELALVETASREYQREAALRQALDAAGECEKLGKFTEALAPLESFSAKYGSEAAVEDLRKSIFEKREEVKRAAELREISNRVNELLAANNAEAAVKLLHDPPEPIKNHPEIAHLRALAAAQLSKQNEWRTALDRALSRGEKHRSAGDFEAAQQALAAFTDRFGSDPKIAEMEALIRGESEARRRDQHVTRIEFEATQMLAGGQVDEALQMLREQPSAVRQTAPVARILADAERQQRESIEKLAGTTEPRPGPVPAFERLAGTTEPRPGPVPAFERLAGTTEPRPGPVPASAEKLHQLKAAESYLEAEQPLDATRLLIDLQGSFRDDPEILALLQRAAAMQQERNKREQLDRAEGLRKRGDISAARAVVGRLIELYPADLEIRAAAAGLEQKPGREENWTVPGAPLPVQQAIQEAEQLASRQNYPGAVERLEAAAVQYPKDETLKAALERAVKARDLDRRDLEYAHGRAEYQSLLAKQRFEEAAGKIRQMLVRYPDDPQLRKDLEAANGSVQARKQRLSRETQLAGLETLHRAGDAEAVRKAAQQLLAQGEEPRVRELLIWAENSLRKSRSAGAAQGQSKPWIWAAGGGVLAVVLGGLYLFTGQSGPATPLSVNPAEVSFNYERGGAAPAAKTVAVSGGAAGTPWTVAVTSDWIEAKQVNSTSLSIGVRGDQGPGEYTGVATVSKKDEAPVNIQVRLRVSREARIQQAKPSGEGQAAASGGNAVNQTKAAGAGAGAKTTAAPKETPPPLTDAEIQKQLDDADKGVK